MVGWFSLRPHSKKVQIPAGPFCVEFACFLWINHSCEVDWDSEAIVGEGMSVHTLSCLCVCDPMMDWRPDQGVLGSFAK